MATVKPAGGCSSQPVAKCGAGGLLQKTSASLGPVHSAEGLPVAGETDPPVPHAPKPPEPLTQTAPLAPPVTLLSFIQAENRHMSVNGDCASQPGLNLGQH